MSLPGIHNAFALSPRIISGSTPEGEAAFAALARAGVRTIISVDGAQPEAALAARHGLRYVHLPHGYDGIATNTANLLLKAAQSLPGPVYLHCHHGRHRGPAAAALVCRVQEGWSAEAATAWLKAAGTATNYGGLYRAVQEFHPPSADWLRAMPADLPAAAPVSGLVGTMVEIDHHFDRLKAFRTAGYVPPQPSPGPPMVEEATLLWERLREASRLPAAKQKGADYLAANARAEAAARRLVELLPGITGRPAPAQKAELDRAFDALAATCAACHRGHRD